MQDHASEPTRKRKVFSGIQPTGKLHLGNYLGAIRHWVANQSQYECTFCIVDLHALTIPELLDPERLRTKTEETAAVCLACGIDPQLSTFFVQSQVSAHTELAWILNCFTPLGWLERMTQYKIKASLFESVGAGLLDYPVLQAADILLYEADLVPVGADQKQHIELARDIAIRFNHLFGEIFVVPAAMIPAAGDRIMGMDDPNNKMSKSVGETKSGHSIGLLDSPDVIRQTIGRAVTDSANEFRFELASAGVRNLLTIYQSLSHQTPNQIESRFSGKNYRVLKSDVTDLVVSTLEPIRHRYKAIMDNPPRLGEMLAEGADRAKTKAQKILLNAKRSVGVR